MTNFETMAFGIDRAREPVQPRDRDPVAAARRVDVDSAVRSAVQAEIDLQLWDMRLAAILNTLAMSMEHAKQRDWTSDHVKRRWVWEDLHIDTRSHTSDCGEVQVAEDGDRAGHAQHGSD